MKAPDAHLHRADPIMARLIDDFGGPLPVEHDSRGRPAELYGALVRGITGQQLSVKAAAAIWRRLLERFDGHTPTPEQILADDPEELRIACGFSHAKVAYLRSLAEHVVSGELELDRLEDLPDDEVIRELTAVKGIGEWTAHMFLMFTLHRPDVLANRRPRGAQRGHACVRAAGTAQRRGHDRHRRAVASAPHARLPVPVAQPQQRTGEREVGAAAPGYPHGP